MDCPLCVGVVGINFKTADLSFREAVARAAGGLTGESGLFFPHPSIVLSTCNRCEIYFSSQDLAEAHTDLLGFFRREIGDDFEHRFYSYFGIDCLSHLCRVASGLDSAILAETEIQRQVKCAYLSQSRTPLPSVMHFLFQKALKVGKEIRTASPSIQGGETIFKVIWDLICKAGINWALAKILFVGNSQINRALIRFLQRRAMSHAYLCTRYPGVEETLEVLGREALSSWERYDLVFSASQSAEYLLSPRETSGSCMIFDLSVPRNVDPEVGEMPGVSLFNIEQLYLLLKGRRGREFDLFHLEEKVRSHALRLCSVYRKKLGRTGSCEPIVNSHFRSHTMRF